MQSLYLKAKEFLWTYLIIALFIVVILVVFSKYDIHVFINGFHSPFFDRFFLSYTNVGDGHFAVFLIVLMLLYSFRSSLLMGTSIAVTGIIVTFIKRVLFYGTPRPITFFKGLYHLYIVPGLEPNEINSFPSGHSATAFAVFLCLAIIVYPVWVKYLFFIFAVLVCYSRMYLSEHFLRDVFAGSIIGIMTSCFVYLFFEQYGKRIWDASVLLWLQKVYLKCFNR